MLLNDVLSNAEVKSGEWEVQVGKAAAVVVYLTTLFQKLRLYSVDF
jgi:hypothetical protein